MKNSLLQLSLLLVVFLAYRLCYTEALKILVLSPNFAYSHVELHGRLADLLVERKHHVHMLIPVLLLDVNGNGTKLAQTVTRYELLDEYKQRISKVVSRIPFKQNPFTTDIDFSNADAKEMMQEFFGLSCLNIITNHAFMAQLKAERFDVAIADCLDICSFHVFHLLDIKTTIGTSAIPMTSALAYNLGLPTPVYVPNVNTAPLNAPHMSLWQRVLNLYKSTKERKMSQEHNDFLQHLVSNYIKRAMPRGAELIRAASFVFINSNEMLEIARPTSQKVKYIGGAALKKPGKLVAEIEVILEKSKKGVVYFSLGSLVETQNIPLDVKIAFLQTFDNFPDYEFIMKVSGDVGNLSKQVDDKHSNVHLVDWVDQTALLAHYKTKAFITHCGLNSLNEAAHFGVPLVAIPMFGDQNYNSAIVHEKGIGVVLFKQDITQDTLTRALQDVLLTNKYMDNMQILKRKLERNPFKPVEVFVRTVEYAAEFQGDFKELNLAGFELNFFQYFFLDFIILLAIVITVAIISLLILFKRSLSFLAKKSNFNCEKKKIV